MQNLPPPDLGDLAKSDHFVAPIEIAGCDPATLLVQLRSMLLIRLVEEKIGDAVATGQVRCPCHLAIGQEAIAVGVSAHLRKSDRIFGGHRSHSHFLAVGGTPSSLFAEVLGKESGCSKGMGGSMHLFDASNGFIGSVPIVAATVPLAVGAALAARKDRRGDVAVAYFGDGAAEEGAVHEAMNFASTFRLPILFVCENNLFSSHLHIDLRQPSRTVARFALAHHIPFHVVDGNDVVAVSRAASELITRGRELQGPGFLEVVTYRWRGHVGPREDIDVGVQRKNDLALWKRRDPIARLRAALEQASCLEPGAYDALVKEISTSLERDWERAVAAPFPHPSNLMSFVYAH